MSDKDLAPVHDDFADCPAGSPDNCPLERCKDDPWRHQVTERIDAIDGQIAVIRKNTEEIVAFFEAGKGFFQVVRVVGTIAKWITTIGGAVVVLWLVFKYGVTEIIDTVMNGKGNGGSD